MIGGLSRRVASDPTCEPQGSSQSRVQIWGAERPNLGNATQIFLTEEGKHGQMFDSLGKTFNLNRFIANGVGPIMISKKSLPLFLLLLAVVVMVFCKPRPTAAANAAGNATSEVDALKAFADLHPIDAHVHVFRTAPEFQAMLEQERLTLLNILVVDDTWAPRKELQPQIDDAWKLVHSSKGHVFLCTTFDGYKFNSPTFTEDSVRQINRDFNDGAISVKIWKTFGMEIKDSNGKYVLPDDPKLQPIFEDIAKHDKTLLAHLAEPDLAWEPLDVKKDPLAQYYIENPQWHMLNKPGVPSKKEILEARDHILEKNPNLRVVGVHLGSMERDLDDIARHLDKYPNFAVDTAARMEYLMYGDREKVRTFLIKYQDRVIYGTDLDVNPDAKVEESVKEWKETYVNDWKFFATDETFQVEGRTVHGLKLPKDVLQKIYRTNAQHWIKGL
jgi:predicted TIM-barrel fold metal-dependent hydrolase